jgi:phosphotransferase system  glucose/maltose/N-acetylglucosamine-specific IIC component
MSTLHLRSIAWPLAFTLLSSFWPLAIVILPCLLIFWVMQLLHLMSMREEDFPGPNVRLGWVALFIFVWALAPFIFYLWQRQFRTQPIDRRQRARTKKRKSKKRDSSKSIAKTPDTKTPDAETPDAETPDDSGQAG